MPRPKPCLETVVFDQAQTRMPTFPSSHGLESGWAYSEFKRGQPQNTTFSGVDP